MSALKRGEAELDRLIETLHESRLRVWSIVMSFFGDAIRPRGGVLWLSTFRTLAARLNIESGTVGAAMSRLTADGWLVRDKRGRHTLYRLDAESEAEFEQAERRIYGIAPRREWAGRWSIVVAPNRPMPDGFVRIDEQTWARPIWTAAEGGHNDGVAFVATSDTSATLRTLVDEAWNLRTLDAAYRRWIQRFSPLMELDANAQLAPLTAMCVRTLLIQGFRRVALKDPELPDAIRPPDWAGFEARRLAAALYQRLLPASETWLDASDATPEGRLPRPRAGFYKRFGGLR